MMNAATKKFVCIFLFTALLLGILPNQTVAAFTDITDTQTQTAAAVLAGMDITTGTTSTSFSPNTQLTRAQFCAFVIRMTGQENLVATAARKNLFSDVPSGSWYAGYVNLAYENGLINGYGNGTFGPEDCVTYGQAATILLRVLGYSSAEVGSVWPSDYTTFLSSLGIGQGLSLSDSQNLTRRQAAILLYHTLETSVKGNSQLYYETLSQVSDTKSVIILDTETQNGYTEVYSLTDGTYQSYPQANSLSADFTHSIGTLLLNSAGKITGYLPDTQASTTVTLKEVKSSGLTDTSGTFYQIPSSAVLLYQNETYSYGTGGYLHAGENLGAQVTLYYDDDVITYLTLATADSTQADTVAVATTASAETELAQKLGISGTSYTITKNAAAATSQDLGLYDVGYYDATSQTLRVSDYKVTGYLQVASPTIANAQTVTIAGGTFSVLECAWESLETFQLGDRVTVLLTDDCQVAAAYPASTLTADMVGILSSDGRSVTLSGSGITLSASELSYKDQDLGALVTVTTPDASSLRCTAVSSSAASVDFTQGTVGNLSLASNCLYYEWTGAGPVYDLAGNPSQSSSSTDDLIWTDRLSASQVSYYHVNENGLVDILLLKDVTGNCYQYGAVTAYSGTDGINLGGNNNLTSYNNAVALTNSGGTTVKYLCALSTDAYCGLVVKTYSSAYQQVCAVAALTKLSSVGADAVHLTGDSWYLSTETLELPISQNVEVYLKTADTWLSGESGFLHVMSTDQPLTVYYDRTPDTGAQVRILVVG